jgi:hypothetical protein
MTGRPACFIGQGGGAMFGTPVDSFAQSATSPFPGAEIRSTL